MSRVAVSCRPFHAGTRQCDEPDTVVMLEDNNSDSDPELPSFVAGCEETSNVMVA